MVRPKRNEQTALTTGAIKQAARRLMAESGTAGLSLRGTARLLNVTAPAIYNYYPRLDDLITALIIDAFTDLAETVEAAQGSGPLRDQIKSILMTYRRWAVEHPLDFQLIYGNPIPGYHAPSEVTGPLAFRPFLGLFKLFSLALEHSEMVIPAEYRRVPASVINSLETWQQHFGLSIEPALVSLLMTGWGKVHGLILLELFGHLQPVVGDAAALYEYEVEAILTQVGMQS